MRKRLLAFTVVVGCLPALTWSQVPLGPAFRVNAYTTNDQLTPVVAMHPDGRFVVVWQSNQQDGSSSGVFARLHDETGTPLGGDEFRVNATTQALQFAPAVATLPGGSFVVVWTSSHDAAYGIFGRRFDAEGLPGAEFSVNTYTTNGQERADVAAGGNGQFVVVWDSNGQDGNHHGIFGQRYDATAAPLGAEFQANTYTTGFQRYASVAMGADGRWVVVWTHNDSNYDVHGQRYDETGVPVGGEFRVNGYTIGQQAAPSVAMAPDGGFVVVWDGRGEGGPSEVFGRRFGPSGAPLGGDFRVNTTTTGYQAFGRVATDADGHFVVVWLTTEPDDGAVGRRFDAAGNPETAEFPVGPAPLNLGYAPVSTDGAGNFVVAWTEGGDTGYDVFARRFRPDVIFKDGFETVGLGAWSATSTDGGDLTASIFAAMKASTVGLRGVVDDTAGIFVQDDTPNDERLYSARFYLDPNGFDPGEALARFRTRVFIAFSEAPTRRVATIVLRRLGGAYSIRARARLDDNTQRDTPFIPIDDGPHAIELFLLASSGPEANGGRLFLFIDGTFAAGHLGLDNSLAAVDFVRMGALSVKPGASGTLHWDEFESRRQSSPIGP